MKMSLLEKVKKSLRINHNLLDDEIEDTINACKKKMAISGVFLIDEDDALIIQAVKTYCKAEIGLLNNEKELYQESFRSQVEHLSLSGDYNEL